MLDRLWGPHTVDRFTSELTTQLPRFNSLYWDPKTEAVDAMMQNWVGENNFVNAPFWMLPKIIRKVKEEGAKVTLIAPVWSSQVWFCELVKLSVGNPFHLPNTSRVMIRVAGVPEPMKNRRWRVCAWRICGKNV